LSALGIYGVTAYGVTQRTKELGVRIAIGAQQGDVLRMVMFGAVKLAAIGVGVGLTGALLGARLLSSQLYGVDSRDPLTYAGKSTLLAILGLLDTGWTGEDELMGERVDRIAPKARAELGKKAIGFVFQQYHLLDGLTVAENLEVPLSYRGLSSKERQALVADALDRFRMVGKKDLYPTQLSGGQQQLVGVARAVIAKPPLLRADEPTGKLHSAQAEEIMQLFSELNRAGTTIVQVTHSEKNASY